MSDTERRFFYCDAPSPLHEEMERAIEAQNKAHEEIMAFAKSIGAHAYASRKNGFVYGFIFKGGPPKGPPYHWKEGGKTDDGDAYFVPKKLTKDGKNLARRMARRWYRPAAEKVVQESGMNRDVISGHYFCHSTCGWKDGRIFISVPIGGSGDKMPVIPPYMTECKKWEMERWFDVGREAATT